MSRKRKRWLMIGGALVGIVLFLLFFTKPPTPAGRYVSSPSIGAVGDWYEEFSDGKVTWVLHEDADSTYRDAEGSYTKTEDGRVFMSGGKHPAPAIKIECFWYGLRMTTADGHREFMRRRLVRGRRPEWMLDHMPWWVQ